MREQSFQLPMVWEAGFEPEQKSPSDRPSDPIEVAAQEFERALGCLDAQKLVVRLQGLLECAHSYGISGVRLGYHHICSNLRFTFEWPSSHRSVDASSPPAETQEYELNMVPYGFMSREAMWVLNSHIGKLQHSFSSSHRDRVFLDLIQEHLCERMVRLDNLASIHRQIVGPAIYDEWCAERTCHALQQSLPAPTSTASRPRP